MASREQDSEQSRRVLNWQVDRDVPSWRCTSLRGQKAVRHGGGGGGGAGEGGGGQGGGGGGRQS